MAEGARHRGPRHPRVECGRVARASAGGEGARPAPRAFNPKRKKAAERLDGLRPPEGEPIPPNTLAELHRDMVRRRLVSDQIRQIEDARLERLEHAPGGWTARNGAPVGARDRGWHRNGRHAGAGGVVAKYARPTGRSALCRLHWLARRER